MTIFFFDPFDKWYLSQLCGRPSPFYPEFFSSPRSPMVIVLIPKGLLSTK